MTKGTWKHFAFTLALLALSAVSIGAGNAQPQDKTKVQKKVVVVKQPTFAQRETWRKSMVRSPRPKKGCFMATYPEAKWKEIPCETPRPVPFGPAHGPRPFTVGNGTDFSAQVTGNTTAGSGTFENVSGVTSVTGGGTANKYSLQLNTNPFVTSVCSGAANPGSCRGWEQFIYSSVTLGEILIQYWLLGYNNPCPAGWTTSGGSCFINNAGAAHIPLQAITNASLGQMTLNGDITDQVTLTVGGNMFSAPGDNHFPDLSNGWRFSEFNIFGDSAGTPSADFNPGATMDVRTSVNSGTGAVPPTCSATGFTGEVNNLTLVSAPAMINDVTWPSIVFTQSNNAPTPVSCDNADSIGDTHIKTFAGLLYDFQASGDFVLTNASDFAVQARQAMWGNGSVSVNKGVATQMGKTRVALYIEPTRLVIDGRAENLADGKDLLLPTGVQVSRRGNVYAISNEHGDRVRAVLNSTWMDVHVGLGHTPQPQARGLLGKPKGSAQELVMFNGAVLKEPVSFTDLYHGYADGWRVQPHESLFAEATTIKAGIPEKLFFASHLGTQERARALAVCKAAGIKTPALLDACTLDNAVLKDEAAARVFVHTVAPRVVIKPVLTKSVLHPVP